MSYSTLSEGFSKTILASSVPLAAEALSKTLIVVAALPVN
jgi:hypothetical protein